MKNKTVEVQPNSLLHGDPGYLKPNNSETKSNRYLVFFVVITN
jgi:hypothetical protein